MNFRFPIRCTVIVGVIGLVCCATQEDSPTPERGHRALAEVGDPLASAARAYLTAIDADDEQALSGFLEQHYSAETLAERGVEGWTTLHLDIAGQIGPTDEQVVVESSPDRLEVLTRLREEDEWLAWTFMGAGDDDSRLKGIRVVNAAPPDVWAPVFTSADAAVLAERLRESLDGTAVAFAVFTRDGPIDSAVAGHRKHGETVPVAMDDAFHIGSCTKTVTAMLVASLVEEGRLSWEDTIAEHFGDFPEIHPAYRDVTLADVARHRAGLVGHSADIAEAIERYAELPGSPTEQRAMYLRDVLRTEPEETREQTHYSNAGFCLLAHVCERVLGEPYEDLVESRVLAPAGVLRAMFGWPATPDRPHGVWGHSVEDGVVTPFDGDPRLGAFLAPAGDLALSIDDFARVVRQHLLGPEGESPVASAEGFREMHRRVGSTYGAGIGIAERREITHLGHAGSTGVHWARYRIWPEFGVAAVMAVNGPVDPVAERTVDAAFDAVVAEWQ